MSYVRIPLALIVAPLALGSCSSERTSMPDTGNPIDTGMIGMVDTGIAQDTGPVDTGPDDTGADTGAADTGAVDTGPVDTGAAADTGPSDSGTPCTYPPSARPMAIDQAITDYSWPEALDGMRNLTDLSLYDAYCNSDPDIDWSPFKILLFVSIPAW